MKISSVYEINFHEYINKSTLYHSFTLPSYIKFIFAALFLTYLASIWNYLNGFRKTMN